MLAVNTNTASAVTHNALTKISRSLDTALSSFQLVSELIARKMMPRGWRLHRA